MLSLSAAFKVIEMPEMRAIPLCGLDHGLDLDAARLNVIVEQRCT
jgi:hypothetical protein